MADSDPVTKKDLEDLKQSLTETLIELVRDVETSLLASFHGYGKGQALPLHALDVGEATLRERLDILELRVLNLETRRPH